MSRPSRKPRLPGRRSVSYLIAVGAVGTVGVAPLLPAAPALAQNVVNVPVTVQVGQQAHITLPGGGDYGLYNWPSCGKASWQGTAWTFDTMDTTFGRAVCTPTTTSNSLLDNASGDRINVNITVIPAIVAPAAPASLNVTPGDGSLTLNWSAVPGADAYEYSLDGGATWSSDLTGTSTTVSGLANGDSYAVVVRALTSGVPGSASSPVAASPLALPSIPAAPSVASGIGQLTLSWAAADPAEQVDGYEYTTDGGATWAAGTSGTTVSGLAFGPVYEVGVRSHNASGYSLPSVYLPAMTLFPLITPPIPPIPPPPPVPVLSVPSQPAMPTISLNSTSGALTITWAAADSAELVDGYEYTTDGGTTWTAGTSPTTVSDLPAGLYQVGVRAHNATGYSLASAYAPALVFPIITPPAPPSTPTVTPPAAPGRPTVASGQRSITLSWPAVTGATSYEYSLDGGHTWSQPTTHRSVTVNGLQDGRTYTIKVRALTGSVAGAASVTVMVTTKPAAKPAPAPAPAIPPVQLPGSRGSDVAHIQQLLNIPADGIYGPQTAAAVRNFQVTHHLLVDGIVGRQTWTALLAGGKTTTTAATRPWLQFGSTGSYVREVQQQLGIRVDGIFGAQTRAAVVGFQSRHHLQTDGIVGSQTWAALLGR